MLAGTMVLTALPAAALAAADEELVGITVEAVTEEAQAAEVQTAETAQAEAVQAEETTAAQYAAEEERDAVARYGEFASRLDGPAAAAFRQIEMEESGHLKKLNEMISALPASAEE